MAESWVINASPLIVLARINKADLLGQLANEVVVPQVVADEIHGGPEGDSARRFLDSEKLKIIDTPSASPALLSWDLGAGETAVLSYAMINPGWITILDDKAARKCARAFSLPVKGTLGVVLLAKQRGLIPSATGIIRQLRSSGFRLDDTLVREALRRAVGENWD